MKHTLKRLGVTVKSRMNGVKTMKRILVACGSGLATSQVVADKIRRLLAEQAIEAEIVAVGIKSLQDYIDKCDIYVSIVPHIHSTKSIPTFSGVPFLTGRGMEEELCKIVGALEE